MPNVTTMCPILLFLPAIILALVAAIVGFTHLFIAWQGRKRIVRGTVIRKPSLVIVEPGSSSARGLNLAQ